VAILFLIAWNALATEHARFTVGDGRASAVSRQWFICGACRSERCDRADLEELLAPSDRTFYLFGGSPQARMD